MHSFSSLYNENTVISKEYTGPLDFDITEVDCIYNILGIGRHLVISGISLYPFRYKRSLYNVIRWNKLRNQ